MNVFCDNMYTAHSCFTKRVHEINAVPSRHLGLKIPYLGPLLLPGTPITRATPPPPKILPSVKDPILKRLPQKLPFQTNYTSKYYKTRTLVILTLSL